MVPHRHYVCVRLCGYNILILAGFVSALSARVLRRRRTWLAVVVATAAYVVFVGAGASVVCAGLMGLLVALAPTTGRRSFPLNALALAALGMALQQLSGRDLDQRGQCDRLGQYALQDHQQ